MFKDSKDLGNPNYERTYKDFYVAWENYTATVDFYIKDGIYAASEFNIGENEYIIKIWFGWN